jgi:hypothetical protein
MESPPAIPPFVGSWKLYFHDPSNPNWQEKDYILLATITSWKQYWNVMNAISDSQFEPGGFFLMKEGYPPRYEHYTNRKGGAYQIQISKSDSYRKFFDMYCISMILESITEVPHNEIVCVTISLKRDYYILKVWNKESALYNKITDIRNYVKTGASMLYAFHNHRDC